MSALYILIPVSLGMALLGLCAFFWAMKTDQFDDPEGSAWRVIAPEIPPPHDRPPEDEDRPHERMAADTENRDPPARLWLI